MNTYTTSSVVILQALGQDPDGVPAKEEGACALCGLRINPGEFCAPLALGPAFMDDLSLAARGSQIVCGHCGPLLTAKGLMTTGYGAFSPAGHAPFRKWADIARLLTDPPEPPFVMTYATSNNQHMAWRSPVNLSRDLFYVRVGLRDLKIRRKVLLAAVDTCRILGESIQYFRRINKEIRAAATDEPMAKSLRAILFPVWTSRTTEQAIQNIAAVIPGIEQPSLKKALQQLSAELEAGVNPDKKTLPHPFAGLSPNLKDANHGELQSDIWNPVFHAAFEPEIQKILDLTSGEVWALLFVLTPGAGSGSAEA